MLGPKDQLALLALSDSYVKRAHPHIPLIFFWFLVCTKFTNNSRLHKHAGLFQPKFGQI